MAQFNLPDLEPKDTDSKTVRGLKEAAIELLNGLPADFDFLKISQKMDLFSALALRIKPKETEGGLAPFVFNPIQKSHLVSLRKRYRARPRVDCFRGIRDIILKPRQLGFTTYIAALFFIDGLLYPGRNSLILTHLNKVSQEVLDKYRNFYECLPSDIKEGVELKHGTGTHLELRFVDRSGNNDPIGRPNSSFLIHTAEGFDLRGLTFQNLHCSEAAFYGNWQEVVRGVLQSIPRESGNIFLESTANGFNHFKDLVDGAIEGNSYWHLVFYSFLEHPEYIIPLTREESLLIENSLNPDEKTLVLDHKATMGHIKFRRLKLQENGGSTDGFRQEYPSTIAEAFVSTSSLRFDSEIINKNLNLAKQVQPLYQLEDGIWIYAEPTENDIYLLPLDPAEGIESGEGDAIAEIGGTDYSAGSVISALSLRTFAEIHGKWEPAEFARKAARLGAYFDALIIVERNNHGHTVNYVLEEAGYPRLYRHLEYDASGASYLKLGFPTTVTTKAYVVDALAEVIKRDALPAMEWRFWQECTYFVRDPVGRCGAISSRHDDRVMSKAIGVFVATLGAKAWGGTGLLDNADGANLPMARVNAVAVAAGQSYPSNGSSVSPSASSGSQSANFETQKASFISQNGANIPPREASFLSGSLPSDITPEQRAMGIAALAPRNPSELAVIARLQESREAVATSPKCANCVNHFVRQDGQSICALQNFTIRSTDPACGLWEPKTEEYNEPMGIGIGGQINDAG